MSAFQATTSNENRRIYLYITTPTKRNGSSPYASRKSGFHEPGTKKKRQPGFRRRLRLERRSARRALVLSTRQQASLPLYSYRYNDTSRNFATCTCSRFPLGAPDRLARACIANTALSRRPSCLRNCVTPWQRSHWPFLPWRCNGAALPCRTRSLPPRRRPCLRSGLPPQAT